jgi:hypothetical protein
MILVLACEDMTLWWGMILLGRNYAVSEKDRDRDLAGCKLHPS